MGVSLEEEEDGMVAVVGWWGGGGLGGYVLGIPRRGKP